MSLPAHVRAACRKAMRKPVKDMAERVSNVHEKALEYGCMWDHVAKEYVYIGK